jgi:hypothetical protein
MAIPICSCAQRPDTKQLAFVQVELWRALACCALLLAALFATGTSARAAEQPACTPERRAALQQLTKQRLAYHQRQFADIQFVALPGGCDPVGALTALELLLGYQPTPLDYEHPPELSDTLRLVSVERIATMMQYQMPSATLFQCGEQAMAKCPQVCVITLAPCAIANDHRQATACLLDLPVQAARQVRDEQLLDADKYLNFTLDHEAFHCLDASLHGGMPRGYETYWGEYWRTRNEMAADAYAVAMHIRRHGQADAFLTNLARLRGLSLLDGDPQHFTYDAIEQVRRMPAQQLVAMSPRELVELARRIGGEQLPNYPAFVAFWMAAHQTMEKLGIEAGGDGNQTPAPQALRQADAAMVARMTTLSHRLHQELVGD